MTYPDWITAGRPAMELSVKQFAAWIVPPVTAQYVNNCCKNNALKREGEGYGCKIHVTDPVNFNWIKARDGVEPHMRSAVRRQPGAPPAAPLPGGRSGGMSDEEGNSLDLESILEAIERLDLSRLPAAAVQKIARLESALKTRVERMAKRQALIDRALVAQVFAKLYQIDTNELLTLGAKVTPIIAAEFGIEEPESMLRIEKAVDQEQRKILTHVKRLLDDFLKSVGFTEAV